MNAGLVEVVTFLAVAMMVAALSSMGSDALLARQRRIRARLGGRLGQSGSDPLPRAELFKNLSRLTSEGTPPLSDVWNRFQDMLVQSGLPVTAERVVAASGLVAALGGLVGWLAGGWCACLVGTCAGGTLPLAYLRSHCRRRRRVLCGQLPEAFELMARAVRAGQTMTGAFQLVARDLDPPLADEFAYCYEQQNLGRAADLALRDLARRTGVIELQMFVAAMLVQRRSGGNIVELLTNLSAVVRKRLRLAGKVRALTSEGRLQALVLAMLPIGVFAGLFVVNRPYVQVLLDRPHILGTLAGLQLLGALWVRKIVNVDY
ncbi:MAG TPA: type II secretion system F family protein [Pirellulales bacterium]|jgi:tight adherence protein B|nr:type II secretion system F family protein [Pirellulales bacterium]